MLWQVVDGKLQPVRVTVGVSDGTNVAVTSDALQEGTTIATGVRSDGARVASAAQNSSPLVPSVSRRRPGGAR